MINNGNVAGVRIGQWVTDSSLRETHLLATKKPLDNGARLVFLCGGTSDRRGYAAPWYPRCAACARLVDAEDTPRTLTDAINKRKVDQWVGNVPKS